MDAKHRHELKTNELADWLVHVPDFLKKNASTIIGVILILAGLVTWPMFSRMRQGSDRQAMAAVSESIQNLDRDIYSVLQASEKDDQTRQQATGALVVNASALIEQADKTDNPDLAAMAHIKAAQALRTELHIRAERVPTDDIQTRIGQAQDAYNKALKTATTPTLKAMAKMGLGLCAEELGQRDAAKALYEEIVNTPEFAATIFPAQAEERLKELTENLEPFVFTPAPQEPAAASPAAPAAEQPAAVVTPAAETTAPAAAAQQTPATETAPAADAPAQSQTVE